MRHKLTGRIAAGLLLGAGMAICAWCPASANPSMETFILTHVQPLEDTLCGWMPFWYCTGLRESTALMGPLEFDLISRSPELYCDELTLAVSWPADWVLVSAEVCGPGPASFEPAESGGVIRMPDLEGLAWSPGGFGMAKLVLNVTSPGWFEVTKSTDCEWILSSGARAGSSCGDCVILDPCTHEDLGRPVADLETLELQAGAGSPASGQFRARNVRVSDYGSLSFVASENWMTLDVQTEGDPGSVDYVVTVNTSPDLTNPGVYGGTVEVHAPACHECVQVVLTVTDEGHPAAQPETWGSVKSRYR